MHLRWATSASQQRRLSSPHIQISATRTMVAKPEPTSDTCRCSAVPAGLTYSTQLRPCTCIGRAAGVELQVVGTQS